MRCAWLCEWIEKIWVHSRLWQLHAGTPILTQPPVPLHWERGLGTTSFEVSLPVSDPQPRRSVYWSGEQREWTISLLSQTLSPFNFYTRTKEIKCWLMGPSQNSRSSPPLRSSWGMTPRSRFVLHWYTGKLDFLTSLTDSQFGSTEENGWFLVHNFWCRNPYNIIVGIGLLNRDKVRLIQHSKHSRF